jgi:cytochrome c553
VLNVNALKSRTGEQTSQPFRVGERSPDAMGAIAKKLEEQDILAVAAYYQQVNSPLGSVAK